MTDKPLFSAEDFAPHIGLPQIDIIHIDIAAEIANALHDERCIRRVDEKYVAKLEAENISLRADRESRIILIEQLEAENARLREALVIAADDIHLEFCGTEHHSCCLRARAALEGKCPEMPNSWKEEKGK